MTGDYKQYAKKRGVEFITITLIVIMVLWVTDGMMEKLSGTVGILKALYIYGSTYKCSNLHSFHSVLYE